MSLGSEDTPCLSCHKNPCLCGRNLHRIELTESRVIELIREELRNGKNPVPYSMFEYWHDRNMRADKLLNGALRWLSGPPDLLNKIDAYFRNEPEQGA